MTKYIIAVLIFVCALAGLLLYIGETSQLLITSTSSRPGLNFETQLSWRFAFVAVTVVTITLFVLWAFLGWLVRLPQNLKSGVSNRRRTHALEAMEAALIAGSEGDAARARKKSEKARGLIKSPALGHMISAQAAEACGDHDEAIAQYALLLDDEKTMATGQRGLAHQMLAKGDILGAIEHSGKAYNENKNARWAFDVLFNAQVADYRWVDALMTLDTGLARKHIEKDIAARRRAVVQTALADVRRKDGEKTEALVTVLAALKDDAGFAPAISLAALLLKQEGQDKKAAQLIEKAWGTAPHPAMALAYRDLFSDLDGKTLSKKIRGLMKANPDHRESQILAVEDHLAANDGVSALSALAPLIKGDAPSSRICLLAYSAETKLGNIADAQVWLQRAAMASTEPNWTDLDPEGTAFDYQNADWRRLVFSFGDKGELIHPRFETGAAKRDVVEIHKPALLTYLPEDDTIVSKEAVNETVILKKVDEVKPINPELTLTTPPEAVRETQASDRQAPPRQPDDPGVLQKGKKLKDDLAQRLDSLLDNDPKSKS